jgi:hypothetical protein
VGGLDFPGELPSDELELAEAHGRHSPVPLSLIVGGRLSVATRGREHEQAARALWAAPVPGPAQ